VGASPNPTVTVLPASDIERTDWSLVVETGAFMIAVAVAFWLALHATGQINK
jgi:hypothetical protein